MYVPKSNEIICKDKKTDKDFLKINKKRKKENKNKSENTVQVDGKDKDYSTINRKKKYDVAQKVSTSIRPNTKDVSVRVDHVKKVTWADVVKR